MWKFDQKNTNANIKKMQPGCILRKQNLSADTRIWLARSNRNYFSM